MYQLTSLDKLSCIYTHSFQTLIQFQKFYLHPILSQNPLNHSVSQFYTRLQSFTRIYNQMTNQKGGDTWFAERYTLRRQKFGAFLRSDPSILRNPEDNNNNSGYSHRNSNVSVPSPQFYDMLPTGGDSSPYLMSPFYNNSPYNNSPWTRAMGDVEYPSNGLIGSFVREQGHIYSLAVTGDLLFTGSDSKNIRVWKNFKEFSGFKSNSGLVKAIVVFGDKIFSGHQDGKIRVWRGSVNKKNTYKKIGNLPTTKDYIKSSMNPKSYVEVRRHRNVPWIRHYDAVSCLSLDTEQGILYSGSWDKTLKVWRLSDSKCLESIVAHDDAVNAVVVSFDGLVFTGSADGTVKVWRRELVGKLSRHVLVDTLLRQEYAVTAVAVNATAKSVYCGSSDGLVNYWEREKHFLSHGGVLRGHKLAVLCMATAGNLVMSGSADKSICVWRRENGGEHTCLTVLTGHTGPVKCLAVKEDLDDDEKGFSSSNDDQRWIVYSGSLDKSVKIWRVSEYTPDLGSM